MKNELEVLFIQLQDKPIAYHKIYSDITGSLTSGVLLSQLLYWYKAMGGKQFYKTDKDFMDELSMGLWELKGAKKKLLDLGLISTERKGIPAKTYYNININSIIALITSCGKTNSPVVGKTNNLIDEKPTTTTENTQRINRYYKNFENKKQKQPYFMNKPMTKDLKQVIWGQNDFRTFAGKKEDIEWK